MSQMPTLRFVFRVRERAFILAFGPLCGWVLGAAPDGYDDQIEAKAERGDPGWRRIYLQTLPPDAVLNPLDVRAKEWDLAFPDFKSSTERRDDTLEREFVKQYAAEVLQYVHVSV